LRERCCSDFSPVSHDYTKCRAALWSPDVVPGSGLTVVAVTQGVGDVDHMLAGEDAEKCRIGSTEAMWADNPHGLSVDRSVRTHLGNEVT